jgi:ADP-heptose:LPS heptosyltransferase
MEERSKMVVLHPGSGSKRKVWPLDRFQRLAEILQGRLGSKILVVLGPAEEREVERVFGAMDPQTFIQVKGFSLLQIASLMQGCRAFIGNDSGISHMACALGIPTIAIFGPTDSEVWAPRGKKVWIVRKETPCSPCTRERILQCTEIECLRGIGVEEILEGLGKIGIET